MIEDRIQRCGTWWRGKSEQERFLLYYTCLRHNYEMPAQQALRYAKANWHHFGPHGDLIATLRREIGKARERTQNS